jgi:uncharacterized small protein (DUF1192 family)
MEFEDLEPRKAALKPKDLDALSVEELTDYIAALEAEIARAKAKITAKEAHRTGAAALFKSS